MKDRISYIFDIGKKNPPLFLLQGCSVIEYYSFITPFSICNIFSISIEHYRMLRILFCNEYFRLQPSSIDMLDADQINFLYETHLELKEKDKKEKQ